MTLQKAHQRRAASRQPALVHRRDDLIQGAVGLLRNQRHNFLDVIVQRRAAPAKRFGSNSPIFPPVLMPAHRRTDADFEAFRRLATRRSLGYRVNDTFTQIR